VQADGARHALELDRTDLTEGDLRPNLSVDHRLADDLLTCLRVCGDPRRDVDRWPAIDNRGSTELFGQPGPPPRPRAPG